MGHVWRHCCRGVGAGGCFGGVGGGLATLCGFVPVGGCAWSCGIAVGHGAAFSAAAYGTRDGDAPLRRHPGRRQRPQSVFLAGSPGACRVGAGHDARHGRRSRGEPSAGPLPCHGSKHDPVASRCHVRPVCCERAAVEKDGKSCCHQCGDIAHVRWRRHGDGVQCRVGHDSHAGVSRCGLECVVCCRVGLVAAFLPPGQGREAAGVCRWGNSGGLGGGILCSGRIAAGSGLEWRQCRGAGRISTGFVPAPAPGGTVLPTIPRSD